MAHSGVGLLEGLEILASLAVLATLEPLEPLAALEKIEGPSDGLLLRAIEPSVVVWL